jgi:hypothetical protein
VRILISLEGIASSGIRVSKNYVSVDTRLGD